MAVLTPTIQVLTIAAVTTQYSVSVANKSIISFVTDSGEPIYYAFVTAQVTNPAGNRLLMKQYGSYEIADIKAGETIDIYFAKDAGTVPDIVQIETWVEA